MKRVIAVIALALALPAGAADNDWMQRVGGALGKPGTEVSGGIYQISLPRTDLHVMLDGVELKPALALSSWLTFQKHTGGDTVVMGDLVLTQEEIELVMQKLAGSAIEMTALHNNLLRSDPVTMYMHVTGHGKPAKLARALHDALALSRTPLEDAVSGSTARAAPERIELDMAAIDRALGRKGTLNGGVYQVSVPRTEAVTHNGLELPPAMGVAVTLNFQPTGGGKAATTGDSCSWAARWPRSCGSFVAMASR
jgi:hypothetical protein